MALWRKEKLPVDLNGLLGLTMSEPYSAMHSEPRRNSRVVLSRPRLKNTREGIYAWGLKMRTAEKKVAGLYLKASISNRLMHHQFEAN
jgi:hypothetical protein